MAQGSDPIHPSRSPDLCLNARAKPSRFPNGRLSSDARAPQIQWRYRPGFTPGSLFSQRGPKAPMRTRMHIRFDNSILRAAQIVNDPPPIYLFNEVNSSAAFTAEANSKIRRSFLYRPPLLTKRGAKNRIEAYKKRVKCPHWPHGLCGIIDNRV